MLSLKLKVQIGIFECTGIMGQDLVHPYIIQSTTVFCDKLYRLVICTPNTHICESHVHSTRKCEFHIQLVHIHLHTAAHCMFAIINILH